MGLPYFVFPRSGTFLQPFTLLLPSPSPSSVQVQASGVQKTWLLNSRAARPGSSLFELKRTRGCLPPSPLSLSINQPSLEHRTSQLAKPQNFPCSLLSPQPLILSVHPPSEMAEPAETCIVCLSDLSVIDADDALSKPIAPSTVLADSESPLKVHDSVATSKTPLPPSTDAAELVAQLLPCEHFLHDECLKPWVERANSCPICRRTFNMVQLSASLGGKILLCSFLNPQKLTRSQRSHHFVLRCSRQSTSSRS